VIEPVPTSNADDLTALAAGKLTRVLGPERGTRVLAETLEALKTSTLRNADELYAFAERLATRGGIEAAVAGLLSVAAVMRGAVPPPK
jgi:hypothetical protein